MESKFNYKKPRLETESYSMTSNKGQIKEKIDSRIKRRETKKETNEFEWTKKLKALKIYFY